MDWSRPDQCSIFVTPNGGWLTGGPWSIGYCGGVLSHSTLPVRDRVTGVEILNYKFYNIDYTQPLATCESHHGDGTIAKTREMVCPIGMWQGYYGSVVVDGVTYSSSYCYSGDVLPQKNLGDCKDGGCGLLTRHPIHTKTGNKFKEETDYSGPDGLRFQRFYNHGGMVESQSANFGGNWFTRIGRYWRHTFDRSILYTPGATLSTAAAYRADGKVEQFNFYNGAFAPDKDIIDRLEQLPGGGWKLTTSNDDVEIYDVDGNLLTITSRGGIVQTMTYSNASTPVGIAPAPGLLIGVTDSFGRSLAFTYNASAQLVTMTNPAGGVFQYQYDTAKNLTSVTYPDLKVRTYVYNELANTSNVSQPAALTGIVDESNVRFATYQYDTSGRATFSGLAGGADSTTLTFNANGTTTVTDALGTSRTFQFRTILSSARNTGVSSVCANCGPVALSQSYDANGNVSSKTDFNNVVTNFSYDLTRNLQTSRTEAFGTARARTITTAWNPAFRIPATITELNRTTSFTFDSSGNVLTRTVTDTSVTPNVSRTWAYTYNAFGRVLTEDGPRTDVADVTTYAYYSCTTGYQCGQVNTITNAAAQVTTYNSYNANGQPTQITDPNGLVTTLAYDARQRLADRCVGSFLPACSGGELTHLDYWPTGLLKKISNPDASYIEYTYDAAHRLTQINDGAGNKTVYTLDNAGNRTAESSYDPSLVLKRTHSRAFNTLNQLWKEVNAAGTANVTTVFGYDNNGNQTTANAPLGRNSTNLYDELNRLKQITDPASGTTQFGYDVNDNLTSVTDPRTLVTSYTYTGFGDLKTQTSPDAGITTNTYDSGGNLKTSTDARSAITTYNYDVLNRVTSAAFKIGSTTDQTITYTYDAGTNGKGHLTGASDAKHSMAWTYDAQGRVTGKAQVVGTFNKSIGYGYNTGGQLVSTVLPSGNTITYGYNGNGQVTSVTLNGAPNLTIVNNVTYDPFGPITGWTWGNAKSASRTFDTDGKLTEIASSITAVGNRTFGYDDAFRITSTTDSVDAAQNWTLGYDLPDRLNSATKSGTTIGYTYDADGNRLTQTGTSASTYTVSATSNKLSSTIGALVHTYTYNASGSVLTSGATTHTYYNSGRMKTGKLGAASATTYIYNALGQRVKKSGGGAIATIYMYDEAGHVLGEYNSSGALVQETVWLGDIPIATLRPNGSNVTVFYVHTDQLNTPRKVTNTSNQLRWKWDPTPFGEGTPIQNPGGQANFVYNLRFPGQLFDSESNLNYNSFRDYDVSIGRYLQADPIERMPTWQLTQLARSRNQRLGVGSIPGRPAGGRIPARGFLALFQPYVYATDNPVSFFDTLGLAPEAVCEGKEGWSKDLCKACVKAFCQIYPAAIPCCVIERDECYAKTGGDPVEMERCNLRFGECLGRNRNGGQKPPKPPEDI